MRNTLTIIFIGGLVSYTNFSQAQTLEQTYQLALANDPTYEQNRYDELVSKEGLPIAVAKYLPQVSLSANTSIDKATPYGSNLTTKTKPRSYGATITQQIFNIGLASGIRSAHYGAKAAEWLFKSQQQDLITRTSNAYFAVISDYKALQASRANVAALQTAYKTAQASMEAGSGNKVDVSSAQAKLDQATALNISATAKVKLDVENLRAITNTAITEYDSAGENFKPEKNTEDSKTLVASAQNNNALLRSQEQATLAAKTNFGAQLGNWAPSLSAQASLGKSNANYLGTNNISRYDKANTITLNFSMTPFAGGGNFAALKQARYQYESNMATQNFSEKSTISQTRQTQLSLNANADKIAADKSSIKSAKESLIAAKELYEAGQTNIQNQLDASSALFTAQQNYQTDVYNYFTTKIALQQATGALSGTDLKAISDELRENVNKKAGDKINLCSDTEIKKDTEICPGAKLTRSFS
jgi:outer membrane protein